MSRLTFKALAFMICAALISLARPAPTESPPALKTGLKTLFHHGRHEKIMKGSSITCAECHTFAVKAKGSDPLAPRVGAGFLNPPKGVCHQCHIGTVSFPRPNQCTLCHADNARLAPADHKTNWRIRHGWYAQQNNKSCTQCHSDVDNSCTKCHAQKDVTRPFVHPPNFTVTHGISARANPQACIACHSSKNTCTSCHLGVKK
ncbi:MAG TPA: cytochrome c3 family protein [Bdellovibrionales bacterium]|nr:cytochrome c3 family protein [Bdellovibrionales bacterium]